MFEWFYKLKSGATSFEDAESLGRSSTRKTGGNMIQIMGQVIMKTDISPFTRW
jgi:hypothetical protein